MLTKSEIELALVYNEEMLRLAIERNDLFKIFELKFQRDLLKNELIDAYKNDLNRKAS